MNPIKYFLSSITQLSSIYIVRLKVPMKIRRLSLNVKLTVSGQGLLKMVVGEFPEHELDRFLENLSKKDNLVSKNFQRISGHNTDRSKSG